MVVPTATSGHGSGIYPSPAATGDRNGSKSHFKAKWDRICKHCGAGEDLSRTTCENSVTGLQESKRVRFLRKKRPLLAPIGLNIDPLGPSRCVAIRASRRFRAASRKGGSKIAEGCKRFGRFFAWRRAVSSWHANQMPHGYCSTLDNSGHPSGGDGGRRAFSGIRNPARRRRHKGA